MIVTEEIDTEPRYECDRCHAPKGEQALGESCNNNCGGSVIEIFDEVTGSDDGEATEEVRKVSFSVKIDPENVELKTELPGATNPFAWVQSEAKIELHEFNTVLLTGEGYLEGEYWLGGKNGRVMSDILRGEVEVTRLKLQVIG